MKRLSNPFGPPAPTDPNIQFRAPLKLKRNLEMFAGRGAIQLVLTNLLKNLNDELELLDPTTYQPDSTKSSESSANTDPSLPSNDETLNKLLSDEAPLLALLSEDSSKWNDLETAKAFVAKLQAASRAPQTLKSLLNEESEQIEKRRPTKAKTPEEKAKAALDKLMSELL